MTEATVVLAAGCLLQIAQTRLEADSDGWVEYTHLEVAADPACPRVVLPLPAHTEAGRLKAKTRLGDGTGSRLPDARWELTEATLDGARQLILHLPELVSGDRVVLDVQRHHPAGKLSWRPGAARFWQVETGPGVVVETTAETSRHRRRARLWTTAATADLAARVSFPDHQPPPEFERLGPPGSVDVRRSLRIMVPPGDPQISLFPGGGSTVEVQLFLAFGPSSRVRGWTVPAPSGSQVTMTAEPRRVAELVYDAGVPRVRVAPTEGTAKVTVSWVEPNAPTFGERADHESELSVRAQAAEIAWEGDAWRLVELAGRPILPTRKALLKGLAGRFRRASLPEPSVPPSLRGLPPSWEVAEQLRPQLLARSSVGRWPADPVWVRQLNKARRTGALTPTEAALVLTLYARQLQFGADWALVRPAWRGSGPEQGPSGFTRPLVRLTLGNEAAWVDPSCQVCGPFELPAELQGAQVLSPGVEATPDPKPGQWTVIVRPDDVEWQLSGPPALELRRWLAALPASNRTRALAHRLAGPHGRITVLEGIAEAGAAIRAVASRGPGLITDPLNLPNPAADGSVWLEWVGERRVEWRDGAVRTPSEVTVSEGIDYRRWQVEGGWSEALTVGRRHLDARNASVIRDMRALP